MFCSNQALEKDNLNRLTVILVSIPGFPRSFKYRIKIFNLAFNFQIQQREGIIDTLEREAGNPKLSFDRSPLHLAARAEGQEVIFLKFNSFAAHYFVHIFSCLFELMYSTYIPPPRITSSCLSRLGVSQEF